MDESGLSNTGIMQWQGDWGGIVKMEKDNNVAMFYNKAVNNPAKSAEQGRPVYENRVFVRIAPPGERLNIVDRPLQENDKHRYPIQWAQFQQNREQLPEGTPIDLLY